MADKACQEDAVGSAVTQVNQPLPNRMIGHRRVELIARNTNVGGGDRPALVVSGLNQ